MPAPRQLSYWKTHEGFRAVDFYWWDIQVPVFYSTLFFNLSYHHSTLGTKLLEKKKRNSEAGSAVGIRTFNDLYRFEGKGSPFRGSFPWARSGSGPLHPEGLYLGWIKSSTALMSRRSSVVSAWGGNRTGMAVVTTGPSCHLESEALASSASSEGRTYNSSNRRPGVRHSTFESLRLGLSSQSIASGFLRFWDSLNFKKDREFVGITVLFLDEKVNSVIHGFTPVGRANHYMPSLKADSIVKVDRFEVLQVIANTNLEIGKHSIFGSSKQDYNQANSSGMTYQQLKMVISQQLIPYFPYLKKSTVFLIYFFIYATLASVMDSSLPRIALTMVSGKKKILLLKKDRDNPVIFSLACLTSGADETQHPRQTKLMQPTPRLRGDYAPSYDKTTSNACGSLYVYSTTNLPAILNLEVAVFCCALSRLNKWLLEPPSVLASLK
ncbi:LOW QUALITY PROTEIN: hypothetical protein YC2023_077866 [Brassica napus]